MRVLTTSDAGEILGRIESVLLADPVRNTVFASVRDQLRRTRTQGWCAHHGTALAARSAADTPIALTARWPHLPGLADAIEELPDVAGLGGPVPVVEALVGLLGRAPAGGHAERLYRLDSLVEPAPVPGRPRLAGAADVTLVAGWVEPFTIETRGALPADFDATRFAESAVLASRTWLWESPAGVAVSMAALRAPAAGVSRIGPVYTAPEHRGCGYAAAVTARAVQEILGLGAVPVLYADPANPTSNHVYRSLGFRPVADRAVVVF